MTPKNKCMILLVSEHGVKLYKVVPWWNEVENANATVKKADVEKQVTQVSKDDDDNFREIFEIEL